MVRRSVCVLCALLLLPLCSAESAFSEKEKKQFKALLERGNKPKPKPPPPGGKGKGKGKWEEQRGKGGMDHVSEKLKQAKAKGKGSDPHRSPPPKGGKNGPLGVNGDLAVDDSGKKGGKFGLGGKDKGGKGMNPFKGKDGKGKDGKGGKHGKGGKGASERPGKTTDEERKRRRDEWLAKLSPERRAEQEKIDAMSVEEKKAHFAKKREERMANLNKLKQEL